MNKKGNIMEDVKRSNKETGILENNLKEFESIYESITGYKYDHNDTEWNEFVLESMRARGLSSKITSYIMNSILFLVGIYIVGYFVFDWFQPSDPLLDQGFLSSFLRFKSQNIIFSLAVNIMILYFVLMPYLGPFGIALFKMRQKISLTKILSKTIKLAKGQEIYTFVVTIGLVALILFVDIPSLYT